jgi:hypothetical protein
MAETPSPRRRIVRWGARTLVVVGALVFVFGDRFLAEFAHINFFLAMVAGILSGLFLMIVGYLIHKSL